MTGDNVVCVCFCVCRDLVGVLTSLGCCTGSAHDDPESCLSKCALLCCCDIKSASDCICFIAQSLALLSSLLSKTARRASAVVNLFALLGLTFAFAFAP